jgi:hypothetical protein
MKVEVGAADHVLKLYAHAKRSGDGGAGTLEIENWLPDHAGQTANQKTEDSSGMQPSVDPVEWWNDPDRPPTRPE